MDSRRQFESLEKRFFNDWVKRNPILGSSLGFHDEYDEKMPDASPEREADDHAFFARWTAEFSKVDPKGLPPETAVTREFALWLLNLWTVERAEVRLWERCPETGLTVGHALYQILHRNYAPLKDRMKSLTKRLDLLPKFVEQSRGRLKVPSKYYVENELETLTRLPGFFNTLRDISREHLSAAFERQMHKLIESAQNALEKYSDWLIVDILPECREEWAIGEDAFRKLVAARGFAESPSTIASRAESEMSRHVEKLKELARQVKRKTTWEDARDLLKQQHADGVDAVLRHVRELVGRAKQFVNRSKFASIPEHDSMYVIETPAFLRHVVPLSGYWTPGKYDHKRDGYFWVTPGDCDSDKLKEHAQSQVPNLTTHGSYPGRHLQGGWSIHHPSLLRTFAASPDAQEGWASYSEERVKELGFEDNPMSRFMLGLSRLTAAARVVLDVRLNTGKMGFVQGVEYLIDHVGMDRVVAESEVRRITMNPGVPTAEYHGKAQILELKKQVREQMHGRFSETFFHNAFLKACPLPLKLMKKELEWRVAEELAKPVLKEGEKAPKKPAAPAKAPEKAKAKPAPAAKKPAKAAPKAKPKPKSKPKPKPRAKPKGKPKSKPRPKPKAKAKKPAKKKR